MKTALNDHRLWKLGAVVVAAVLMLASWFLLISPELSSADAARAAAAATRQANDARLARLGTLKRQAAQVPLYRKQLDEALAALPADSGLPAFTRQLVAQAAAAHIVVDGITVGGITAAGSNGAPATGTAPAQSAIYNVQVSVVTEGLLSDQLTFLKSVLYQGARRALVTGTAFTPSSTSQSASIDQGAKLVTQLSVFSAPRTPAQLAELKRLMATASGN